MNKKLLTTLCICGVLLVAILIAVVVLPSGDDKPDVDPGDGNDQMIENNDSENGEENEPDSDSAEESDSTQPSNPSAQGSSDSDDSDDSDETQADTTAPTNPSENGNKGTADNKKDDKKSDDKDDNTKPSDNPSKPPEKVDLGTAEDPKEDTNKPNEGKEPEETKPSTKPNEDKEPEPTDPPGNVEMGTVEGEKGEDLDDEDVTIDPAPGGNSGATNPPDDTTKPGGNVLGSNFDLAKLDYEGYMSMTGEQQRAVIELFGSPDDFMTWFKAMEAIYKAEHPEIEIGGDGTPNFGN